MCLSGTCIPLNLSDLGRDVPSSHHGSVESNLPSLHEDAQELQPRTGRWLKPHVPNGRQAPQWMPERYCTPHLDF